MPTQAFVVELGDPKVDAPYLLRGFDVSFAFAGWVGEAPGRPIARKAAMRVPLASRGPTWVALEISPGMAQEGELSCAGRRLARFATVDGEPSRMACEIPPGLSSGTTAVLEIDCQRDYPKPRWFGKSLTIRRLEVTGEGVEPLPGASCPIFPPMRTFWGDLHVHTNLSLCKPEVSGSIEENCLAARDGAKLDFLALTDHAEHVEESTWKHAMALAGRFEEAGRFVLLPAYEWSSAMYGNRNVYYRGTGPLLDCVAYDTATPEGLWRALRERVGPRGAITVPHHPAARAHLMDWGHYDPEFDRLVEICQRRGQQERLDEPPAPGMLAQVGWDPARSLEPGATVHDALMRGYRLGFVGGADAHGEWAGSSCLTAVRAARLARDDVFDALYERRCYATTGARIELDFHANGWPMGSVVPRNRFGLSAEYPIELTVRVRGTDRIDRVEFLANGWTVHVEACTSDAVTLRWSMPRPSSRVRSGGNEIDFFWLADFTRFFHVRVHQADGHRAWASPVWFVLDDQ